MASRLLEQLYGTQPRDSTNLCTLGALLGKRRSVIEVLLVSGSVLGVTLLPLGDAGTRHSEIFDLGHLPLFAALAWYAQLCLRAFASIPTLRGAFLLCAAVAMATEGLQGWTGRSSSMHDFLTDLAASAAMLAWLRAGGARPPRSALLRACALVLVAFACWPAGRLLLDQRARSAAFPLLLRPESSWSLRSLGTRDARLLDAGAFGFRFEFDRARHAAVFVRPIEGDWSNYETLTMELESEEPLELMLRIDDDSPRHSYRNRFERTYALPSGPSALRIALDEIERAPDSRPIDLGSIESITIFVGEAQRPRRFTLRGLRLEGHRMHDPAPTADSSR